MGIPFYMNTTPNWSRWEVADTGSTLLLREGHREVSQVEFLSNTPDGKPSYQIIGSTGEEVNGGICRKFIGLESGRTYKVTVRLNTMTMSAGDWSYTYHAAINDSARTALTVDQMAGTAALPDGASGTDAGCFARYGKTTTGGEWVFQSTADTATPEQIAHIYLPEGHDTFTVWSRLQATGTPVEGVAFDWISVEPVSEALTATPVTRPED